MAFNCGVNLCRRVVTNSLFPQWLPPFMTTTALTDLPWDLLDSLRLTGASDVVLALTCQELSGELVRQLSEIAGCRALRVTRLEGDTPHVVGSWAAAGESGAGMELSQIEGLTRTLAPLVRHEPSVVADHSATRTVAVPFLLGPADWLVLELGWRTSGDRPESNGEHINFSWALVEWLGHQVLRNEKLSLSRNQQHGMKVRAVSLAIHESVLKKDWGDSLATTLQGGLGYDRIWLLVRSGPRFVLKGSSLPAGERDRLQLEDRLQDLVRDAADRGVPLTWEAGVPSDSSRKPDESLLAYVEANQLRSLRVEPLPSPENPGGDTAVLVLERYRGGTDPARQDWVRGIFEHAGVAVTEAIRLHQSPWSRGTETLRQVVRSHRWQSGLGVLILTGIVLSVVPCRLVIEVEGQLQPQVRRGVFAPLDGIVEELNILDGKTVDQGEFLLKLRSPQIEAEQNQVTAELGTKTARLASLQASRTRGRNGREDTAGSGVAEQEELEAAIEGLRLQAHMLLEQRESLTVASPIAGTVDRWNLEEMLSGRPVTRGQELLRILDVRGQWRAELMIPEEESGYVTAALRNREDLPVKLQLLHSPGEWHDASLREVGSRTEVNFDGRLVLRGLVPLTPDQITEHRSGAGVLARIDCGRRALGFVCFRKLLEFCWRNGW